MSTIYPKLQESFQRLWWLYPTWGLECQLYTQSCRNHFNHFGDCIHSLGAGMSTIYPKLQESFQRLWRLYPTWDLEFQLYTQSCRNHFNHFGDCIQLGSRNVNYIPKVAGIISTTLVTVSSLGAGMSTIYPKLQESFQRLWWLYPTWGLECQLYTQSCRNHFNDFGDCIQLGGWNVNYIPKVAGIISTTLVTVSNLGAGMSTIYPKLQESFQRLWLLRPTWGGECQLYTQSCRNHFNDFGDCIQLGGWNVNYIPKVAGISSTTLETVSNLGLECQLYTQSCRNHFNDFGDCIQLGAGMSTIYPKLQESFQRLWWLYPAWGLECQLYTQSCRNHFNDFGDCIQLGGWNVNYIPKVAGIISTTLVTVSSLGAGMSTIYPKLQESFQRLWWLYPTWELECQLYTQSCRNHFNDFGDCIQLGGWNVNYIPKVAGIISTTLVTVSNLGAGMSTIYPKLQESFQRL